MSFISCLNALISNVKKHEGGKSRSRHKYKTINLPSNKHFILLFCIFINIYFSGTFCLDISDFHNTSTVIIERSVTLKKNYT